MSEILTVTEMSRKFADYMNRVKYRGESFILTKSNKPFAEIRPLEEALPQGLSGEEFLDLMRSLPHLNAEETEAFARDIEEAREEINNLPVRDPWEEA